MKAVIGLVAALLPCLGVAPATAASPPAALPGDSVYQYHASLTDSSGRTLQWQDLRGKPRIATLFYTSCRYICPLVVDSMRGIERQLAPAERQRLGFVLITMDPARDTPEALAKVMTERRLEAERWQLLQPRAEDLRGLAGLLGIRYRSLSDGEFNHTTALVLLDADGRILSRSDRLGANTDPGFMAAVHAAAAATGNGSDR